jgi:hypothetical protein
MSAEDDAVSHYETHGCEDTTCAIEAAWESFIEFAADDERFTDGDGEWLPGYPDKLDEHDEWDKYVNTFVHNIEVIIRELSSFAGWEDYYGTSRSD